ANFAAQYRSQPGRPLAMLSFVINDSAWPSSPWSFKYTNLMLHALVGVLVFGFARHLARLHLHENRSSLAALIVAAAWLIHPMQLSTSMLVVQRMTQLSALFALAGLWAFLVLAHRAASSASSLLAVVVLGIGTILATLCKETGALTPLLAHIILQTLMRERLQTLPRKSARILCWGTALPVALLAAAIALRWEAATVYDS